ncbi:uncharacterized protein TRIVIDRAFT_53350 [Trichoderma virens Gv29-8]|uniref:Serine aminopeptidase S33 domain-containing protein n=1 Tax=Hypocrea virens (strain Gv29-8 / FGSC 10586) TaxID=413071 RepID=G9MUJ2_HYPVG|nr:uncharacterized protein TRIVIDRAFT_53350 [Trichoderma virens Gv29-8]EHK21871.1 hypothetical protein TRIVIDRAFT_53350 [Trichoderma virens Gv29-8]UKZ54392.1 hypothetical protein TrVGV298_008200 [Trichoderma virens]
MTPNRQWVEFPTLDGLILRGWLYPAQTRGPAIILNPGFNCVKEMFVPEVAAQFQNANITALIYDTRSLGQSDGEPRNELDPALQVSDFSDALSFMKTLPIVDPAMIGFWGMSFGATVALCAASLDERAKWCIAVCPLVQVKPRQDMLARVLRKTMKDRESRLLGNTATFLPVLTENRENPAGMGMVVNDEGYEYIMNVKNHGAPNYENQTTMQTYYRLISWQPFEVMRYLHVRPSRASILMIVPENDQMSPPETQMKWFDSFPEPKKIHVAIGKGHLDVLSGGDSQILADLQVKFLLDIIKAKP